MKKHEKEFVQRVIDSLKSYDTVTALMNEIEDDIRKEQKKRGLSKPKPPKKSK